jgi:hypothetical protein
LVLQHILGLITFQRSGVQGKGHMQRLLIIFSLQMLVTGGFFGGFTTATAGDGGSIEPLVSEAIQEEASSVTHAVGDAEDDDDAEQTVTADSLSPLNTTTNVNENQAYLVATAHPGTTMMLQGPVLAIERLHPEFALRLANAIREARQSGLPLAGIFSAYRPPVFGIGGFVDKFNSLHTYGLAVDMQGIGGPGTGETKLWREIAARHGIVCPYAVDSHSEWNHCQPTQVKIIPPQNPLRAVVSADGPLDLEAMFEIGNALVEDVSSVGASIRSAQLADANAATEMMTRPFRRMFVMKTLPTSHTTDVKHPLGIASEIIRKFRNRKGSSPQPGVASIMIPEKGEGRAKTRAGKFTVVRQTRQQRSTKRTKMRAESGAGAPVA